MATVATGYPVREYKSGYTRLVTQVTLIDAEVYVLTHPELSDASKIRKVYVVDNVTGTVSPAGITSIVLNDSFNTTVTAAAVGGAGTYNIVIEL